MNLGFQNKLAEFKPTVAHDVALLHRLVPVFANAVGTFMHVQKETYSVSGAMAVIESLYP